jgi:hypothetical protein
MHFDLHISTCIYEGEAKKKAIEALVKSKREKVSQKMDTEATADGADDGDEDEDMDDEEKIRIDELLDGLTLAGAGSEGADSILTAEQVTILTFFCKKLTYWSSQIFILHATYCCYVIFYF